LASHKQAFCKQYMGIGHCKRRKKKFTAHIYRRNISREMDDSCQRDAKKMRE